MRRTSRLFEIIQLLRGARRPVTAAAIAQAVEVTVRTVYRDIASLQGMGVPILGEAGVGYVMRTGYDLPPLTLTVEEVEAVAVAIGLLARTGDIALEAAARSVHSKIEAVLTDEVRRPLSGGGFYVSAWGAPAAANLAVIRLAIRDERKLDIAYADAAEQGTRRVVRPVALAYYVDNVVLAAWCDLRGAFRHFRADRIRSCTVLDERFAGDGAALRAAWLAGQAEAMAAYPLLRLADGSRP